VNRWIAITLVALAALFVTRWVGWHFAAGASKLTASTAFILTAYAGGALSTPYGKRILGCLAFSWWGDAFLIGSDSNWFLLGLISFLCAHILYCLAFFSHGTRSQWTYAGLVGIGLLTSFIMAWMLPRVPAELQIPVIIYVAVITVMSGLAIGTFGAGGTASIAIGALMFYVSDIAVAIEAFVTPGGLAYLWGLPLYYGGQLFLAASVASVPAAHNSTFTAPSET